MRVGCINYAHRRGLGHLAKAFWDHGVINRMLMVKHPGIPWCPEWYPDSGYVDLRVIDTVKVNRFASECDVMLFFETPFSLQVLDFCRRKGVKTFLVPMYECYQPSWPKPYKYLCPSLLDLDYFPHSHGGDSVFLPVPTEYPWRLRERAEHFIHRGGYLGMRGREGATLLIEAMRYVKSPLRLTIQVQENVSADYQRMMAADPRIEYVAGTIPYEELYAVGDVAIQPQKFNGMSCPLQESCAAGLLVMTTDRYPANTWLPTEPLIPVAGYKKARIGGAYLEFEEAQITPQDIAATMDRWYGQEISHLSLKGGEWAESNSWAVLGPQWQAALQS